MTGWTSLPAELRLMVLELLMQHRGFGPYAASCLDEFESLTNRRRDLVKYIWLNVELRSYSSNQSSCKESETYLIINDSVIRRAIVRLFTILSSWEPPAGDDGLTLEFNAYSPSDPKHVFSNCFFGANSEDAVLESANPARGILVLDNVHPVAVYRPFETMWLRFKENLAVLPRVEAVTALAVRRQCRRQFHHSALGHLLASLPRVKCLVYEPWQLWDKARQSMTWDPGYRHIIDQCLPQGLKRISVFEDFNEDYIGLLLPGNSWYTVRLDEVDPVRVTIPEVGAAFASRSLDLEYLSVSFMADARHFFEARRPEWRWDHLQTLVLTSRLLTNTSCTLHAGAANNGGLERQQG
ncbi:hypothetical protein ACJ41O_003292 [Fusarium nematophilum]